MITILNRDMILRMWSDETRIYEWNKNKNRSEKRERRLPIRETIRKDACNNVR